MGALGKQGCHLLTGRGITRPPKHTVISTRCTEYIIQGVWILPPCSHLGSQTTGIYCHTTGVSVHNDICVCKLWWMNASSVSAWKVMEFFRDITVGWLAYRPLHQIFFMLQVTWFILLEEIEMDDWTFLPLPGETTKMTSIMFYYI